MFSQNEAGFHGFQECSSDFRRISSGSHGFQRTRAHARNKKDIHARVPPRGPWWQQLKATDRALRATPVQNTALIEGAA